MNKELDELKEWIDQEQKKAAANSMLWAMSHTYSLVRSKICDIENAIYNQSLTEAGY